MSGIFSLSHLPGTAFPPLFPLADILAHIVLYAILGLTMYRAISSTWGTLSRVMGCAGVLLTVAYGALDELHQWYVPGRRSELADLAADGVGALIGVLLYTGYRRYRARHVRFPQSAAVH